MALHPLFDVLAWAAGLLAGLAARRLWPEVSAAGTKLWQRPWYFASALCGAAAGALILGTLNTELAGMPGGGRSLLGGLLGAIAAVEIYKSTAGLRGPTGVGFVLPLAAGITVGRIGCLLSGLDDFTYGIPTSMEWAGKPWGWDFGDGIPRHPVALYESVCVAAFAAWFVAGLALRKSWSLRHGFAAFALWYGVQRFAWEFLKPYPVVVGPLNLFHLGCLMLICYGGWMIHRRGRGDAAGEAMDVSLHRDHDVRDLPDAGPGQGDRR